MWDKILADQAGEDIFLPVDVWGFPGGQAFLPGLPCLFFEGMGGAISYLEPAMCRYFAPVIQATKARLMLQVTPRDAEFGLRSAPNELTNLVLLLARYVGGRGQLTSNDTAEFLYPELFRSIGTIGHEMMCTGQRLDRSLGEAEYEMMDRFVTAMGRASLLCDLVDAETNARLELQFNETSREEYTRAFDRYAAELQQLAIRNGGRYVGVSAGAPLEEVIFGSLVRARVIA